MNIIYPFRISGYLAMEHLDYTSIKFIRKYKKKPTNENWYLIIYLDTIIGFHVFLYNNFQANLFNLYFRP